MIRVPLTSHRCDSFPIINVFNGNVTTILPVLHRRILSDWLEVKLGGDKRSEVTEKQPDGALQTLR